MNALGGAVGDEFGRGVARVQLDLVHGGDDGGLRGGEQAVEVRDGEVGDADVFDFACREEGLHGVPGLEEVPVWEMFGFVVGVGGGGPVLCEEEEVSCLFVCFLVQYVFSVVGCSFLGA